MNSYFTYLLTPASPAVIQWALLFLRASIGALMVVHGFRKLQSGTETWRTVGSALSYFGINFFHVAWGLLAACTEFFGGTLLIIGLATRIVSLLLAGMMVVAANMHVRNGDGYNVYSHALSLLFVFITFMIVGGGAFSIDRYLF